MPSSERAPQHSVDARHRHAERHGAGIVCLRAGLHRMIPRALDVPEAPLEPIGTIEAGAAGMTEDAAVRRFLVAQRDMLAN